MTHRYASLLITACSIISASAQITMDASDYAAQKATGTLPHGMITITGNNSAPAKPMHPGYAKSGGGPCDCWIEPDSTYSLAMAPNDDMSSGSIGIPFSFQLFGQSYDSLFINNNGNVSFGSSYFTFTASPFPDANYVMVAPFWADVDTRGDSLGLNGGAVWYKITPTAVYVNWELVGYFNMHADKHNSFQLILTNGTDPIVPTGNVSFCYHDMQWTSGDASGGVNGFGGTASTVGANLGDGVNYAQIGRYDHEGTDYDGPYLNTDGISWLDSTHFYFDVSNTLGVPPIFGSTFSCDTVIVQMNSGGNHEQSVVQNMIVLPGGPGQLITCVADAPTLPNFSPLNLGPSDKLTFDFTINTAGASVGTHFVTFTATNDAVVPLVSQLVIPVKVTGISTGVADLQAGPDGLALVPNPTNDHTTLVWSVAQAPCLIEIIAPDGRIVKTIRPVGTMNHVDLELDGLAPGTYMVRATNASTTSTVRLVKTVN